MAIEMQISRVRALKKTMKKFHIRAFKAASLSQNLRQKPLSF
jgi:hypothetical protein